MVGVFVVARVVRFVKRVELTMFNHWTDARVPELLSKSVSVAAFAGNDSVQLV